MDMVYETYESYKPYILAQLAARDKKQLSVVIYDSLRTVILDGRLALNERINEQHLAKALGVSRTPLRKALDQLVAEQLLAYEENRGVRVVNINEETIHEVYAIQLQLDQLLYSEAMRKLNNQQLESLATEFSQLKVYESAGQYDKLQQLAEQFKALVASLARTPILKHLLDELAVYSKRLNYSVTDDLRQQQIALREQLVILNSLLRKEASVLEIALRQQMRSARNHTLRQYRRKMLVTAEDTVDTANSASLAKKPSLTIFICEEATCPLHASFQAMLERRLASAN